MPNGKPMRVGKSDAGGEAMRKGVFAAVIFLAGIVAGAVGVSVSGGGRGPAAAVPAQEPGGVNRSAEAPFSVTPQSYSGVVVAVRDASMMVAVPQLQTPGDPYVIELAVGPTTEITALVPAGRRGQAVVESGQPEPPPRASGEAAHKTLTIALSDLRVDDMIDFVATGDIRSKKASAVSVTWVAAITAMNEETGAPTISVENRFEATEASAPPPTTEGDAAVTR
jgi:hypothetical protein